MSWDNLNCLGGKSYQSTPEIKNVTDVVNDKVKVLARKQGVSRSSIVNELLLPHLQQIVQELNKRIDES